MKTIICSSHEESIELSKILSGKLVAIDTETASNGRILSIQLAWSEIDVAFLDLPYMSKRDIHMILNSCGEFITHYGIHDAKELSKIGYRLTTHWDTFCMARLIYFDQREGFGLKHLASEKLGMEMINIQDVAGKEVKLELTLFPVRLQYSIMDPIATYRLFNYFMEMPWVKKHLPLISMESKLQGAVSRIMNNGFLFDKSVIDDISRSLNEDISSFENKYPVSRNSDGDVSRFIFNKNNIKPEGVKKNKNGLYSVSMSSLESVKDQNPELIGDMIEWKSLLKLRSTYTTSISSMVGNDGRIHSHLDGFGAVTGRFSSSSPNLQNIPAGGRGMIIRKAFIAPPGWVLASIDYKQIEFIIMAVLANETSLLEELKNGGDVHTKTASFLYNVAPRFVTKVQRSAAKTINFGIIYGGGHGLLLPYCNNDWSEAERMYNRYFEIFPNIKKYIDELRKAAFRGFTETYYGRRRKIRAYSKEATPKANSGAFRLAQNTPIQGTAADVIKFAMVDLDNELDPSICKMVLQIHDELIFEIRSDMLDVMIDKISDIMRRPFVFMNVDVEVGQSWFDLKEYKKVNPVVASDQVIAENCNS